MADQLGNWNFADVAGNSLPSLINRQKSATYLIVLALDRNAQTGVFLDREKKVQSQASLHDCSCRDFRFVGKTERKTLQPCMHIYRLAMELGLLEPVYLDHHQREALRAKGVAELKRCEDERLHSLGRDPAQWGGWPAAVHASGLQRNRQYRAYFIHEDEGASVHPEGGGWVIHGYDASLEQCSCADFLSRRRPCKHVYAVALVSGIDLHLTPAEYRKARSEGREIVFAFEDGS